MMEGYATTGDVVWEGKRKWRRPADVALAHETKLTFVEPGKGLRLDERSYSWFGMYGPVVPPPPQLYLKTYPSIPSVIEHWDLGPGEAAVLAHRGNFRARLPSLTMAPGAVALRCSAFH